MLASFFFLNYFTFPNIITLLNCSHPPLRRGGRAAGAGVLLGLRRPGQGVQEEGHLHGRAGGDIGDVETYVLKDEGIRRDSVLGV